MTGRPRRPRARAVAAAPVVVWLASMVATPLAPPRSRARRALANGVVGGLAATTLATAARRWGPQRAGAALAGVATATAAVERVGTATGVPFGAYGYSAALRPQVAGVPALVPLAWFAMAVPAREVAHAALGGRTGPGRRVVVGAAALTAWDLFLDPQMVGEGYWRWARRGRYRGIPLSNFAGWFLTGLGVMALLEVLLPPDGAADPTLVAEYGTMAAMETLGFAAFFRDPLVAAVGGAAMLPLAAAGGRGARRWRLRG